LSQDEIVFDEVQYREPERICRPDRDRRYACLAYELPGSEDLPIFLDRRPADAIERHALRDTAVELGGILLGKECLDNQTGAPFVLVTESLEAKHYENTQASFTYTHDSWEEITRERDRLHPGLDIVGWYHTHPDFGVFLSGHDLFIHQHFFAQPLQVAYVVDPIRQDRGFFQWRSGTLEQVGGFFLVAGRGERQMLARVVNDLESIPNTNGGGGGLSPRLEAELLAMLTRTSPPHVTSAERTLSAALFGLLGMMVGAAFVLGFLWLIQLNRSVQDQAERLERIATGVDRASAAQRLAFETMLAASQSKDPEHDGNLLLTQYSNTARSLDEKKRKLDQQETINGELAVKVRTLDRDNTKLRGDLELARKFESEAKEAGPLRERVDELEIDNKRQARQLAAQQEVLDTPAGRRVLALAHRYDRAWYAAVAGWGAALLLALGLLAAFGFKPLPAPESEGEPGAGPPPAGLPEGRVPEPPTHHIT
jgi:proteasome lid subunit RPN8/RPN11